MTTPSISHLIDFIAIIDAGSLSAAARKLGRAQAAVTYSIQSLERDLGVALFDRTARPLVPTPDGLALMPLARQIVDDTSRLTAKGRSLSQGTEGSVVLAIDTLTPTETLLQLVRRFAERFPLVELDVIVDAMTAPLQAVLDGNASLAICGPGALRQRDIAAVPLTSIRRVGVAAPDHPLSQGDTLIDAAEAARHRRIIMLNRDKAGAETTSATEPANSWRTSDIGAKKEMILAGLGWGNMPLHLVEKELSSGALRQLRLAPELSARWSEPMALFLIHSKARPPGIAGRWLFEQASITGEDAFA